MSIHDYGDPLVPAGAEAGTSHPRFTPFLDVVAALVLLFGLSSILALAWSIPPLERIPHPERALALIVGKSLELEDAFDDVPGWERAVFEAVFGGRSGVEEAIPWYAELATGAGDPLVELQLAILEAEAGRLARVRRRVDRWAAREDPFPLYRRLIEAGYLADDLTAAAEFRLQARLAEALPAGWFYDRLAIRMAGRAGDETLLAATRRAAEEREQRLLNRARGFFAAELAVAGAGLVIMAWVFVPRRKDPSAWRVGGAPIPPRWTGRAGLLILLRGGAAGVLVMIGFVALGPDGLVPRLLMVPLINVPLLWLAYEGLLRPNRLGFRDGFGLGPVPRGWRTGLMVVPVLSGAGLVIEWGVGLMAEPLGLSLHWTDWFDPVLVWGGGPGVGLALVEYLIFAPVFEEIVFRGIVFGTLRRKYTFLAAAPLSAALFALAHGYGPLGFVSVSLSGVLWAWGYERTGSLIPGMLAHFLNNLLVCTGMMLMLR